MAIESFEELKDGVWSDLADPSDIETVSRGNPTSVVDGAIGLGEDDCLTHGDNTSFTRETSEGGISKAQLSKEVIDELVKNKWQTKTDSTTYNSNLTKTPLTFNNLEIGKTYKVNVQPNCYLETKSDNTYVGVRVQMLGGSIGEALFRLDQSTGSTFLNYELIFTATDTYVEFLSRVNPQNSTNKLLTTFVTLEELNNYQETTDWT